MKEKIALIQMRGWEGSKIVMRIFLTNQDMQV